MAASLYSFPFRLHFFFFHLPITDCSSRRVILTQFFLRILFYLLLECSNKPGKIAIVETRNSPYGENHPAERSVPRYTTAAAATYALSGQRPTTERGRTSCLLTEVLELPLYGWDECAQLFDSWRGIGREVYQR